MRLPLISSRGLSPTTTLHLRRRDQRGTRLRITASHRLCRTGTLLLSSRGTTVAEEGTITTASVNEEEEGGAEKEEDGMMQEEDEEVVARAEESIKDGGGGEEEGEVEGGKARLRFVFRLSDSVSVVSLC